MEVVTKNKKVTLSKLKDTADKTFGNLVKAVVDVERRVMVVDAELHSDEEGYLLKDGSKQKDLWGINIYPDKEKGEMVEFDSMINLRPGEGNSSRGVDDPDIRKKLLEIVEELVE